MSAGEIESSYTAFPSILDLSLNSERFQTEESIRTYNPPSNPARIDNRRSNRCGNFLSNPAATQIPMVRRTSNTRSSRMHRLELAQRLMSLLSNRLPIRCKADNHRVSQMIQRNNDQLPPWCCTPTLTAFLTTEWADEAYRKFAITSPPTSFRRAVKGRMAAPGREDKNERRYDLGQGFGRNC